MTENYTYFGNLAEEIREIPKDGILSRAILTTEKVKTTLFGFDAGQELTEHTAAYPAILYFIKGQADLTVGGDNYTARDGTFIHMPARMPHSLVTNTPVVMLLLLLVGEK
ncbi:MAG: cupin domain-containing protein [Anaerolineaceae bacterium]|nr:cupin domain-containing protein [Anaerolineaceae bacterium]